MVTPHKKKRNMDTLEFEQWPHVTRFKNWKNSFPMTCERGLDSSPTSHRLVGRDPPSKTDARCGRRRIRMSLNKHFGLSNDRRPIKDYEFRIQKSSGGQISFVVLEKSSMFFWPLQRTAFGETRRQRQRETEKEDREREREEKMKNERPEKGSEEKGREGKGREERYDVLCVWLCGFDFSCFFQNYQRLA